MAVSTAISLITSSLAGYFVEGLSIIAPIVVGDPDGDSPTPNYSYQWLKNGFELQDATSSSYLVPETGAGSYVVAITYSDLGGSRDTVYTASQDVISISNGIGTAGTISSSTANVFQEGVSLIAATVTGDIDGDSNAPSYTYQWHKNGAAIAAATSSSYVVPATGTGTYKVAISYTDSQGFRSTVDSADQIVASVNDGKAVFVISGSAAVGETLYAEVLKVDPDGNGAFSYRWQASDGSNWLDIGTDSSISIAQPEEGKQLRLLTSYSDGQGFLEDVITSASAFNLDVDNDGKVTALGDGLMVIRKLFGAAFAGDALTNKAISPTARRTTTEIHQFIESGISTGMLDVDKDGKTTALGDGLMVIRHLFGAAFAGEALTNKAISPASPYFFSPANFAAVGSSIDSMNPYR